MQRETRGFWPTVREEVAHLEFLSRFFTWFFMLLSRLAEPLMTLSALYIIVEAGLPRIAVIAISDTAVAIMIAAPEIILPGSFAMAAQAKSGGKPYKLLYAVSWCFVVLTGVTLMSLFVFHLDSTAWNVITFFRCAAGVGYSILIRVLTHGQEHASFVPVPAVLAKLEALTETVEHTQANTERRLSELSVKITETEQQVHTGMRSFGERFSTELSVLLTAHLQPVTETLQALDELAALPERLRQLEQATHAQLRVVVQEVKATLERPTTNDEHRTPNGTPLNILPKPAHKKGSVIDAQPNTETDKGQFVRSCLVAYPEMRNADIQRKAAEQGLTISPAYISETRKAFFEAHPAQQVTA